MVHRVRGSESFHKLEGNAEEPRRILRCTLSAESGSVDRSLKSASGPAEVWTPTRNRSIHRLSRENGNRFRARHRRRLAGDTFPERSRVRPGNNTVLIIIEESVDLGIFKNPNLIGNIRLKARAEAINEFNIVSLSSPNMTLASPAFGEITAASPNREKWGSCLSAVAPTGCGSSLGRGWGETA